MPHPTNWVTREARRDLISFEFALKKKASDSGCHWAGVIKPTVEPLTVWCGTRELLAPSSLVTTVSLSVVAGRPAVAFASLTFGRAGSITFGKYHRTVILISIDLRIFCSSALIVRC